MPSEGAATSFIENQKSIVKWAAGNSSAISDAGLATRAYEEMVELLAAVFLQRDHAKAVLQSASIAIVLFRLSDLVGQNMDTRLEFYKAGGRPTPSRPGITLEELVLQANASLAKLLRQITGPRDPKAIRPLLDNLIFDLCDICAKFNCDIRLPIDAKMKFLRTKQPQHAVGSAVRRAS